jgi:hypothetical protein
MPTSDLKRGPTTSTDGGDEHHARSRTWLRFALYGIAGWAIEVVATGTTSLVQRRHAAATAQTYLWMHPIYGLGGLALERIERATASWPWAAQGLAFVPAIYLIEAASGALLRRVLGRCPWDYTGRGWHVDGLVRLDFAPAWWLVGCLFPRTRALVTRAAR